MVLVADTNAVDLTIVFEWKEIPYISHLQSELQARPSFCNIGGFGGNQPT